MCFIVKMDERVWLQSYEVIRPSVFEADDMSLFIQEVRTD